MIKKILISALIFFVTLETGLRIHGRYYTYTENNGDYYKSDYKKKFPTWYHHWTPNAVVDYKSAEFHYINHYNELGHREKPFSLFVADSNVRKVVCIGDSFTEGDGTCYDSTWVRRFEQLTNVSSAELNESSKEKTVFYNGGVCGSDVFFNNKMLQDKLVRSNPEEVIECLNTSDINDVIWLGGNERFNADGTTSGKHAFWWDSFYHYSHVFRAFIHVVCGYDDHVIKKSELAKKQQKAALLITAQVEKTAQFCANHNIRYRLIIHPVPHEIRTPDSILAVLKQTLSQKEYTLDICNEMTAFYQTHDIEKYSLPKNGHFNSLGYWAMGEIIYEKLPR